jgi:hypothetical protein
VLRHVGRDAMGTTTITDTLLSPPEHAVLPIGSVASQLLGTVVFFGLSWIRVAIPS